MGGKKPFLSALLKAYKMFAAGTSGSKPKPNIAILEFRDPTGRSEYEIYRDYFRAEGFQTELVSPDQLEYRNGVLRSGNFDIDLIYRRISVQEFLLRFTLDHPLVQAYRDRKVCIVNSFRSELSHKKAMFALLTDETLTAKFPINERKAIREHVPWTRVVKSRQDPVSRRDDRRPDRVHQTESREAGAASQRRIQRPAQLHRLRAR